MKKNNLMKKSVCLVVASVLTLSNCFPVLAKDDEFKMVWYFPIADPYGDEVAGYVEEFSKDYGIEVRQMIGPDLEQGTQDNNMRALAADGYRAMTVFPSTNGAAGLYDELEGQGINIVGYGAATTEETELFCVATDVEAAAYTACEEVIKAMGGSGGVLDVLETLTDTNTLKRQKGVNDCIAAHDGVELAQEIAGITSIDEGVEKISSALTANVQDINGIVCTGNMASSAAVQVLDDYYDRNPDADKIYLICIDTPDDVMNGIKEGIVYGTIAQNTFAHGYIPCVILYMMGKEGYQKKEGTFFIDSGCVLVTQDNIDSFSEDLTKVTEQIKEDLPVKYLEKAE